MPSRIVPVDPAKPDAAVIAQAAALIRAGELVAFPTETVYGLGADALDERAVARVFAAKGRPADNPLIVHVADPGALDGLVASVPAAAARLIEAFWPGPLTLVLFAGPAVPEITRGGLTTVAVRMPSHPVALALIAAAGRPLAGPSANRSGRPSPTTARHVADDLGEVVAMILDAGPTPLGVESTVLDVTGDVPVVLRPGGVPVERLRAVVGQVRIPSPASPHLLARSPGTRYRHYAPRTRLLLVETSQLADTVRRAWAEGHRVGVMVTAEAAGRVPDGAVVRVMGPRDDPDVVASALYGLLRELDAAGLDVIVVEAVPERGLGRAVMDRLRRAAGL